MIRANITASGSLAKVMETRVDKEGHPFVSFVVKIPLTAKDGKVKDLYLSCTQDGTPTGTPLALDTAVTIEGAMVVHKLSEANTVYNVRVSNLNVSVANQAPYIKGELHLLGKSGKIENNTDRNGNPWCAFSAYSTEKLEDGFVSTWVRFVQFGSAAPEWLQPKMRVDCTGDMTMSVFNDRIAIECRLKDVKEYTPLQSTPENKD